MARLEDLTRWATVQGILPDGLVTVVEVQWFGAAVVDLTYKDAAGRLGSELLYRDREPTIEIVTRGRPWSFDGDVAREPVYLRRPFHLEPDFGVTSVNYHLAELLAQRAVSGRV